jgi:hypothetical protein
LAWSSREISGYLFAFFEECLISAVESLKRLAPDGCAESGSSTILKGFTPYSSTLESYNFMKSSSLSSA